MGKFVEKCTYSTMMGLDLSEIFKMDKEKMGKLFFPVDSNIVEASKKINFTVLALFT